MAPMPSVEGGLSASAERGNASGSPIETERIQQAKQPEIWKSLPNAINGLPFLWRSSQHST